MSLSPSAASVSQSIPMRALLFSGAAALGFVGGYVWNVDASGWAYNGLLTPFFDPSARIEAMAVGVGLGVLLGLIHVTSV